MTKLVPLGVAGCDAGLEGGYTRPVSKRRRERERDEAEARGAARERTSRLIDELRSREASRRQPDATPPAISKAPDPVEEPHAEEEPKL